MEVQNSASVDEGIDTEFPGLLINPHEAMTIQPKHKWAIVRGKYAYFHYCQHNFEDAGWGCAYRSFQTVCSWFRFQRYIDATKQIPKHHQIQQCLVDIGDKPPKFVGSRQWIGSLELSFCLETMFGIKSKILSSKSGAELAEHARALIYHFEQGGAPVMIGGGQLAHTILGVDYNVRLGHCQWLVLDPHYTGAERLEDVVDGGWCAWKPTTFWAKSSFYNMMVPINPTNQGIRRTEEDKTNKEENNETMKNDEKQ